MILYHGTNQDIVTIDLTIGTKFKDFGQGFYVTPDLPTAERMAQKKVRFAGGCPTIIEYELDESIFLQSDLRILRFPEKASPEWIDFIYKHRDRHNTVPLEQYDIVTGPIADDGVALQLNNYHDRLLTPKQAADALQDKYLDQQYYFGSQKALSYLTKKRQWQIN